MGKKLLVKSAQALILLVGMVFGPVTFAQNQLVSCASPDALRSQTLTFALYHSQLPGQLANTQHSLRVSGSQFQIHAVSQAQGLLALFYSGELIQESKGSINKRKGFEPTYYSEKRGKKPARETVVDSEHSIVEFKKNGSTAQWTNGTQDRLSMIYQISNLLQCNKLPQSDFEIELPIMTTGKLENEVFKYQGKEQIEIGEEPRKVEAIRLSNIPKKGDDAIHLWFDPAQQYLPIQIQVTEADDKHVTQRLLNRRFDIDTTVK